MKIFKNKLLLTLTSIIAMTLIIFGYTKIKEYTILKDAFVFTKENIVSIWRVKKGDDIHDYHYELNPNEINFLSNLLDTSSLKKATIKDCPPRTLGTLTLLLDGKIKDEGLDTSVEFERSITLVPIDKNKVYVLLSIDKPRNDGSFNSVGVMDKFFIIDSERLVEFINKHT